MRLRQEWIARSLTSVAPKYHSRTGECSVYSSLSQFTAPELLTGSNKWACDRCTDLAAGRLRESDDDLNNDHDDEDDDSEKRKKKKPPTVYSNASKQLLIFSPPAVLTIHLKRYLTNRFIRLLVLITHQALASDLKKPDIKIIFLFFSREFLNLNQLAV